MVSFLVEMLRLTVLRPGNGVAADEIEVDEGGLARPAGLLSTASTPLPTTAALESPKSAIFHSAGVQRVGLTCRAGGESGSGWESSTVGAGVLVREFGCGH